jgi:hypothetical protein
VKLTEFEPYINTLGEVYDKYQLHRALGLEAATEGLPHLDRKATLKVSSEEDVHASFNSLEEWTARLSMAGSAVASQLPPLRASTSSINSVASKSIPLTSAKTRMYSGNAPALDTIPGIFMDSSFNLGNPHTFSAVCEYKDVLGHSSNETMITNRLLQEKLSHYLDIVEVHLIKEISIRSNSFFAALANLQNLNQQTEACIDRIAELRKRLETLSKESVKKGLEVVRLRRQKGNLELLDSGT